MKRFAILLVAASMHLGSAAAMDVESAEQFLQGAWSSASETWIFDDQEWTQFNGGVTTVSTFTVEPMPENLFAVVSGASGKRYVVHTNTTMNTMSWYADGTTTQIGFYTRRKPN